MHIRPLLQGRFVLFGNCIGKQSEIFQRTWGYLRYLQNNASQRPMVFTSNQPGKNNVLPGPTIANKTQ